MLTNVTSEFAGREFRLAVNKVHLSHQYYGWKSSFVNFSMVVWVYSTSWTKHLVAQSKHFWKEVSKRFNAHAYSASKFFVIFQVTGGFVELCTDRNASHVIEVLTKILPISAKIFYSGNLLSITGSADWRIESKWIGFIFDIVILSK